VLGASTVLPRRPVQHVPSPLRRKVTNAATNPQLNAVQENLENKPPIDHFRMNRAAPARSTDRTHQRPTTLAVSAVFLVIAFVLWRTEQTTPAFGAAFGGAFLLLTTWTRASDEQARLLSLLRSRGTAAKEAAT
jgi:hypothetical protein